MKDPLQLTLDEVYNKSSKDVDETTETPPEDTTTGREISTLTIEQLQKEYFSVTERNKMLEAKCQQYRSRIVELENALNTGDKALNPFSILF